MHLDVLAFQSGTSCEFYMCARPEEGEDARAEAKAMYGAIADYVKGHQLRICRERAFVPHGAMAEFAAERSAAYGKDLAAVAPTWLGGAANVAPGGIQVHAVRGPKDWKPLQGQHGQVGWTFSDQGLRWAMTNDLCPGASGPAPVETQNALLAAEAAVGQAGMNLRHVARTWWFLDDILGWYDQFNDVRNRHFIERGMLQREGSADASQVPASTGIGVSPAGGGRGALELFAIGGDELCMQRFSAAGRQRCAYEYGSAFARAAQLPTPGGTTLFVSGTAAIDAAGKTCYRGEASGQIAMTIDNIMAVFREAKYPAGSVVQAMAYCRNANVARIFTYSWRPQIPWPWVIVIGDVCRDDLLFEAEVTACRGGDGRCASVIL